MDVCPEGGCRGGANVTTWTNKDDAFAPFDPRALMHVHSVLCRKTVVASHHHPEASLGVGMGGPDSQYRLNASYTLEWAGEGGMLPWDLHATR